MQVSGIWCLRFRVSGSVFCPSYLLAVVVVPTLNITAPLEEVTGKEEQRRFPTRSPNQNL